MRSFLQMLVAVITLGMVQIGCSRPGAPATPENATPTDVTLLVPGMN